LSEARQKARLLLEEIGVEGRLDGMAGEFSWGNQKLVTFARMFGGGFKLVLLDEPLAGVSPNMAERLKTLTRRLVHEMGMSVGLIEHNVNFVMDLADWVVVLKASSAESVG
jgi:branched-chain amino acid transport system ATP-binding protein